jgi:DNA-binding SARP family transcriptional activator
MDFLYVYLFGRFSGYYGDRILTGFDASKVQELFCYLLINRDRPHSRETLADLLWPDCLATQSKAYLRKTLWQLQSALDAHFTHLSDCMLQVDPDWIQLRPAAQLCLDVAQFEKAFDRVRGLPGSELDAKLAHLLRCAVDLYQGDLLDGWYQDWCLYERVRLRHIYMAMLDRLMEYCEIQRDCEAGVIYGLRILRIDSARERTHRRLMRLFWLSGDRTGALRQYRRCVEALGDELDVAPSQLTTALYQRIRADDSSSSVLEPIQAKHEPARQACTLPDFLDHLKRLQVVLSSAQRQIRQDIQAVEREITRR